MQNPGHVLKFLLFPYRVCEQQTNLSRRCSPMRKDDFLAQGILKLGNRLTKRSSLEHSNRSPTIHLRAKRVNQIGMYLEKPHAHSQKNVSPSSVYSRLTSPPGLGRVFFRQFFSNQFFGMHVWAHVRIISEITLSFILFLGVLISNAHPTCRCPIRIVSLPKAVY